MGAQGFFHSINRNLYWQNFCAADWALRVELIKITRMKPTSGEEKWETATRDKAEGMCMPSINKPKGQMSRSEINYLR